MSKGKIFLTAWPMFFFGVALFVYLSTCFVGWKWYSVSPGEWDTGVRFIAALWALLSMLAAGMCADDLGDNPRG